MTYNEAVKQITQRYGLELAKHYTETNKIISRKMQNHLLDEIPRYLNEPNDKNKILSLFSTALYFMLTEKYKSKDKYLCETITAMHDDDELLERSSVDGFLRSLLKLQTTKEVAKRVHEVLADKFQEYQIAYEYSKSLPGTTIAKRKYRNECIKFEGDRLEKVFNYRKNLSDMYF